MENKQNVCHWEFHIHPLRVDVMLSTQQALGCQFLVLDFQTLCQESISVDLIKPQQKNCVEAKVCLNASQEIFSGEYYPLFLKITSQNYFPGDENDSSNVTSTNHLSSKKKEMALAKVSLTIVFIFILCHSVKWIPNIFELLRVTFMEDKRAWPTWVEAVTHISHFLTTFNSSVNFYVYCFKHFSVITNCCRKTDTHVQTCNQNHALCERNRHF